MPVTRDDMAILADIVTSVAAARRKRASVFLQWGSDTTSTLTNALDVGAYWYRWVLVEHDRENFERIAWPSLQMRPRIEVYYPDTGGFVKREVGVSTTTELTAFVFSRQLGPYVV